MTTLRKCRRVSLNSCLNLLERLNMSIFTEILRQVDAKVSLSSNMPIPNVRRQQSRTCTV